MDFCSDRDQETFYSLKRLIEENNGFFKSAKQSKFFHKRASKDILDKVDVGDDQTKICVAGYVRWADYGIRSVRRVEWLYVIDAVGVAEQFKIKFRYSEDGRYSEVAGVESIWKRPKDVKLPEFEHVEENTSEWIGVINSRIKFVAKIIDKRPVETAFGVSYLVTLKTLDGDIIKYWNSIYEDLGNGSRKYAEIGDTVEFMAGVKAHVEFNQRRETMISRVTKAKII